MDRSQKVSVASISSEPSSSAPKSSISEVTEKFTAKSYTRNLEVEMDRSQKVSVGSTSSEPSSSAPKSSISVESDENENVPDLMDSSQDPQRTLRKHFMSPTISAATKASFPRKKIMSNNKDIPFDIPPPQNSLNLEDGFKSNTEKPSSIRSVLANYCSSESDGDELHTKSKPYDPLTNYLSPRPKYLRYNPNRRRRIIDLQESKEEKKDDSRLPPVSHAVPQKVVDSQTRRADTVISPAQDGITKQENQNQLGVGGGTVELKVERGKCSFKVVFEFALLLTIIAFTTSYMCSPKNNNVGLQLGNILLANYSSMNIIIQQQSQLNYMNFSLGYRHVKRTTVHSVSQVKIEVVIMANDSNNDTFDPNNEPLKKLPGTTNSEIMKLDFDKTEVKGDNKDTSDLGFQHGEIPYIVSGTFHELTIFYEDNDNLPQEENEPLDSERIVDQDTYIGQDSSSETEKAADLIDDANELLEIQQNEEETVNIGLIEDLGKNLQETKAWSHETTTEENEHNETFHSTVMDSDDVAAWSHETTKEIEHNGPFHFTVMASDNVASWSHKTSKENEQNGTLRSNVMIDSENIECDGKSTETDVTDVTVQEGITEAQLIAPLLILAFSLLVYLVAQGAIHSPVKNLKPVTVVPLEESRKETASNQAPLSVERKHLQEKVDTALKPSQTPFFMSEKVIFIKAPDVELPGELVFDDVYSSRSSCYKQAKTTDSNQVKKTKSTKSSYDDIDVELLPRGSLAAAYSSIEESTTAESSPSRGSFTAERKISKKQGSRDRNNVKNVVATPVRRSSRIQKLAAVSP